MIVATAGHIDHGKSLLVRTLTGIDTDRLPEEKRRGLSIDLGFAYLPDATRTIGFVDVPGHERFIHNMLCGVASIDCALLVIAADDGPMPQTREHLAILDLLGVRAGLVALTKIDRVSAERVAEVRAGIGQLLEGTALAGSPVFPVSAPTGIGVDALAGELHRLCATIEQRANNGNFRLAVDRVFNIPGAGLIVTGTVFAGRVAAGDTVRALIAGGEARVRTIHAQNMQADAGFAGQRCALNLAGTGLRRTEIRRGDWIVAGALPEPATRIDARLRLLASEAHALRHWTPVHAHFGAAEATGRVAILEGGTIEPGAEALVQLVLTRAIGAVNGDRFVIRDQSARRTIGGGRVIDVYPPLRGRAKPGRLAVLRALDAADPAEALDAMLKLAAAGVEGVDLSRFAAGRNLTPGELDALCGHIGLKRIVSGATDVGFLPAHWAGLRGRALKNVGAFHQRTPQAPGLPEQQLLGFGAPSAAVLAELAAELLQDGALIRAGAHLCLPDHRARFGTADDRLWQRITGVLDDQADRPPTVAELAARIDEPPKAVRAVLEQAARRALLVRVSETRFFLPRTVARLAAIAQTLAESEPRNQFTAARFRDVSGLGRNLSIDLLDYFDRVRFTRRIGDARMVLKTAAQAFGADPR